MRAPVGKPPPTRAPPKGQPPKITAPVTAPTQQAPQTSANSNPNVPKAPPINWFYSWIKKEPFGDNVPITNHTAAMPDPIAKVD
jgi:hypothetical protein